MSTRVASSLSSLSLALSLGCGCGVSADYTLTLRAVYPADQQPIGPDERIYLHVHDRNGSEVVAAPGAGRRFEADQLGPLDEAWVGLLGATAGPLSGATNPGRARAFGAAGPFTANTGGESLSAGVLVGRLGEPGALGTLTTPFFAGGAAVTDAGEVWLFGGAPRLTGGTTFSDRVLATAPVGGGDWAFSAGGALAADGSGQQAVRVDTPEGERILITGGRTEYRSPLGNRNSAALFDPATATFTWEASGQGAMRASRSEHRALTLHDGRVLIVGGLIGSNASVPEGASFEVFDPATLTFTLGAEALNVPSIGLAVASLGARGALVCGGSVLQNGVNGQEERPVAGCSRIGLDLGVHEAPDLPAPRSALAMTTLHDGRVLATGGFSALAPASAASAPGMAEAWLYDPAEETWTDTGAMLTPRVLHQLIPLWDGGALVMGGSAAGAAILAEYGAAADCPERFRPALGVFEPAGPCTTVGAGGNPIVAVHPHLGAFVLEGVRADLGGGSAYGWVATGPK